MTSKASCECGELAIWYYMASDNFRGYCDDCVPRGCFCNWYENEHGEIVEGIDELRRFLPCNNYIYNEKGFDDK